MVRWYMKNELGRIWKEMTVVLCEVISWHLSGWIEENNEKTQPGSQSPD
jgi:hypothetical protein